MSTDLQKMIEESLAKRQAAALASQAPEEIEEVSEVDQDEESQDMIEQPAAEAPAEQPAPMSPLREALAKHNVAADQLSDDDLSKQLAALIAERDAEKKRFAELEETARRAQEAAEQLRYQVSQPQAPQQPQQTQSTEDNAQKLKKWERVEIDPQLTKLCKYDDATSRFLPALDADADSIRAAQSLNAAVAEQQRRSQLLINDPVSAFNEAGLMDQFNQLVESRFQQFQQQLATTLTQRQHQVLQARQEQEAEARAQKFFDDHKAEFFKLGTDGQIMKGLDGRDVVSERGELFRQKAQEIRQQYGNAIADELVIADLAYKLMPPIPQEPTPEEVAKTKKETVKEKKSQFVEKARQTNVERKPIGVSQALVRPAPQSDRPMSFKEMLLTDPDNAEALGEFYQGN